MAKLWQKNYSVDKLVERFTVGDDYLLDWELVTADCAASLAHATMLASIQLLTGDELKQLREGLLRIIELNEKGSFPLRMEDEDCHTAIENFLVQEKGEVGKKIHTGRSRNDQVLTALRIYTREYLLDIQAAVLAGAQAFLRCARENEFTPMPGRTHMQIAMPSSVGLWASAFAEAVLDDYTLLEAAYELNDQCPLGAAASYGVPLPLNREMTSELLGFGRVQRNVLYANNSRGKIESVVLDAVDQIMLTLSKAAEDLIIYSMPEFGYFTLPDELCTGSSIMPQKKNPDLLELVRAKSAVMTGLSVQVKGVVRALPSGYNRDFQETKGPLLAGLQTVRDSLRIMELAVESLRINEENLRRGFTPEIYATDAAFELVKQGESFREAYRRVAGQIDASGEKPKSGQAAASGEKPIGGHSAVDRPGEVPPEEVLKRRTATGTPGNLKLDELDRVVEVRIEEVEEKRVKLEKALRNLTGREISLTDTDARQK